MPSRQRVIWSIFKRNFASYFINPTGYVFITVFIALGAIAAFWDEGFFLSNLANLDRLNAHFPSLLLFFIPSLTMNLWSEERRRGTDELLFTLPCRDFDIVAGKYLAALGIYTVAVAFSLSHLFILTWLGKPDIGLMCANYFGYWLAGAALLAVGMTASLLTSNATVAFILGALLCAAFVFVHLGEGVLGSWIGQLARSAGLVPHFNQFGNGAIPIASIAYFVGVAAVMLAVNVMLLRRRHQARATAIPHYVLRGASLAAIAVAVCRMLSGTAWSIDATAERLHTLQPQTRSILEAIPEDRPVFVQAFFTEDVPEGLIQTRKDLLNILERFDSVAGDRLTLIVHDTEPFTPTATRAIENYNITPIKPQVIRGGRSTAREVFMGLVFSSGPEEFVIPFFHPGLPAEYELGRSVRVVSQSKGHKLGVVATAADVFGGFDFETMQRSTDWSIVSELRKQYDVERVAPDGPYPDDLDALLVVMPSTLTQPQMDALQGEMLSGTPTLLVDDPLPMFNINLSPQLPPDADRSPFSRQGQPPAQPKGDFNALLASIGVRWTPAAVVWSAYNPHPVIAEAAPEFLFLAPNPDNPTPFNPEVPVSSGLQEIVQLYAGSVGSAADPAWKMRHTPLLHTGTLSGQSPWDRLVSRTFFGTQLNPRVPRTVSAENYVTGLLIEGTPAADTTAQAEAPAATSAVKAIMLSDADMISETFFEIRRRGIEGLDFDNVTFALNCIDYLTGDTSFIDLRKHRPQHRTLTRLEDRTRVFTQAHRAAEEKAESEARGAVEVAQSNLDLKVQEVQQRADLDERTRRIMLNNLEQVENRRLEVYKSNIDEQKNRQLDRARAELVTSVAGIQREIKWWAAVLPPIPTLILALILFATRYQREKVGVPARRRVGSSS